MGNLHVISPLERVDCKKNCNKICCNKTDMTDGKEIIDHKNCHQFNFVSMFQFWTRKLCTVWKLFSGTSKRRSRKPVTFRTEIFVIIVIYESVVNYFHDEIRNNVNSINSLHVENHVQHGKTNYLKPCEAYSERSSSVIVPCCATFLKAN